MKGAGLRVGSFAASSRRTGEFSSKKRCSHGIQDSVETMPTTAFEFRAQFYHNGTGPAAHSRKRRH